MPKRPNIAALAKEAFEQAPGTVHPLRAILKDEDTGRIVSLPVEVIEPDPEQPRKDFDPKALEDLTSSIREKGVLQPIAVAEERKGELYTIIFGERRWRAAKAAGLKEIPALVRSGEDRRELALIENLQRQNLTALEEAEALARLKQEKSYTDAALAKIIGKSRQSVSESLSLTKLPETIKAMPNVRHVSKIQLLQVFRAGSPEKVHAAWDAIERGEATTVRALKKRKESPKGRPKHYTFSYQPDDHSFRLTLTFSKARVHADEVRKALREALKHQGK